MTTATAPVPVVIVFDAENRNVDVFVVGRKQENIEIDPVALEGMGDQEAIDHMNGWLELLVECGVGPDVPAAQAVGWVVAGQLEDRDLDWTALDPHYAGYNPAPVTCVICGQPGSAGHEIRRAEDGISYPGVAERDMYVGGTCRVQEES